MSVIIENLTKKYGHQLALDGISFEAQKGKITGFLGPNGAGKSTTMKIASGYIKATSGTVTLEGYDVSKEPLQVKKILGYLPENNPLYLEMYVKEYLYFIANAFKLKNRKKVVGNVISQCGLEGEYKKKIHQLSKGYKQRLGLAQSLIHQPKNLILDEPTSGLDPNQLVEIRKVIKEASINKTVILSTHILSEVEQLCDDVVVINKGKVVVTDSLSNITSRYNTQISYRVTFEHPIEEHYFAKNNLTWSHHKEGTYNISGEGENVKKRIMKIVNDDSLSLVSIHENSNSLEQMFQQLTT